jgi:putative oxidoreductase
MNTVIQNSTTSNKSNANPRKGLSVALWISQILLAVMFGMAGFMKATQPIDQLSGMLPFVAQVPEGLVRFIGASELAGAVGLILPAALRILPVLTPLAASGLVVVMVLAAGFHISRGEFSNLPVNFILGSLAAFVAWGRLKMVPISKR